MGRLDQLKRKREKIIRQLPQLNKILRSTISKYYLTCGYKRCRCHRGKKHGPFIYLSAKEQGKLKLSFVPRELIPHVKQGVRNYNKFWVQLCELCRLNREILWLEKKWH